MRKVVQSSVVLVALACGFALGAAAQGHGHAGGPPMGRPGGMGGPGMAGGNAPAARGGAPTTGSAARTGKTVDQVLAQNTKLSEQLQNLLGPGVNLQQAASGFKNLGQFVAAVHVSKNLNIPFDQLKAEMLKTGSLGKAIKTLDPKLSSAQVREEVRKAQQQARQDIRSSRQRPS